MFDLFGIAARARAKALEEALAHERERSADLLKQVIALSDTRAFQSLHAPARMANPDAVAVERGIKLPTERPSIEAVIAQHRNNLRDKPAHRDNPS